jgi:hypothetical protein
MRDLRCVLRMHAYRTTTNDAGEKYDVCTRCGRETFPMPISGPHGMGLPGW